MSTETASSWLTVAWAGIKSFFLDIWENLKAAFRAVQSFIATLIHMAVATAVAIWAGGSLTVVAINAAVLVSIISAGHFVTQFIVRNGISLYKTVAGWFSKAEPVVEATVVEPVVEATVVEPVVEAAVEPVVEAAVEPVVEGEHVLSPETQAELDEVNAEIAAIDAAINAASGKKNKDVIDNRKKFAASKKRAASQRN